LSSVRDWFEPPGFDHFLRDFFHKLPFSAPGRCPEVCDWAAADHVSALLIRPEADVLLCRQNEVYSGPAPCSSDEVRRLSKEGYTTLVRHAERHDAWLANIAAAFSANLVGEVNVHVYSTPASQFGFAWHYDAEDVFILQASGTKEYLLRKNTVHPWPLVEALPEDMHYEREVMPLLRCQLAPGDLLYIPAGYWHRGEAVESAVSIAVGVLSPTGLSIYDFVRQRLVESLLWRQRLPEPCGQGSERETLSQLKDLVEHLARDFSRTILHERFLQEFVADLQRQSTPPMRREAHDPRP
jgi:ribosomal protein L16 Arg81 hydroxylase